MEEKKEEDWVKAYKDACYQVYDKKLSDVENLMNGVTKERENMYSKCLEHAIDAVGTLPPKYTSLINQILDTTYTDDELYEIAKPHIEAIRTDIKNYITKTADSKRKFNKAQEMRAELDLAKENIDKIMHREQKQAPKLTLWQLIKSIIKKK